MQGKYLISSNLISAQFSKCNFHYQFNKCLQQNKSMSKNKLKPNKQEPKIQPIQQPPQIIPTKQQKIRNLVNLTNDSMYQSIELGDMTIKNVDQIAKQLIKEKSQSIFDDIMKGQFQVSHKPIPYNLSTRNLSKYPNLHEQHQDFPTSKSRLTSNDQSQINSINNTLKQLHESIRRQKQMDKNKQKNLEEKAKQFILKVQKEKEQFQQKLKNKKSSSRLFIRAYSEDTIRIMKDKLSQRVQDKRDQLAQKLKNIQKRKFQRLQGSVNSEVSYWQKVKQYDSCKNLKRQSTGNNLLPQIKYPLSSSRNLRYDQNKSTYLKGISNYDQPGSVLANKFEKIDHYVLKAKLKLHQFHNNSKHEESKSRLKMYETQEKDNFDDLYISNKSYSSNHPDHSDHKFGLIDKFREDLEQSKLKLLGGGNHPRYLPKNLTKINNLKIPAELSPLMGSSKQLNPEIENMSVNASNIKPSKNPIQTTLEESWNLTLNKIQFNDINKLQGLTQLSDIEKRLDKYDKQGIVKRLKLKATVIANIEKEKLEMSESKIVQDLQISKDLKQPKSNVNQLNRLNENSSKLVPLNQNSSKLVVQNQKGLDSSQNQFISNRFRTKPLGKV